MKDEKKLIIELCQKCKDCTQCKNKDSPSNLELSHDKAIKPKYNPIPLGNPQK